MKLIIENSKLKIEKNISQKIIRLAFCASLIFNFQFSIFNCAQAQDLHFSQLDINPLLFNPAYSGFFDGQGRFGIAYRNQWASVSVPFQTFSATAEWTISRSQRDHSCWSAGLWLSNDRAGSLSYGATSVSGILSYFWSLNGRNDHFLSLALEGGVGQVGFSSDGIALPETDEAFERTRALTPVLGAGVAWFRQWSDVFYLKAGLSVRNINEPDFSFLGMSDTRLSRKYNFYMRAEWRMMDRVGLLPVVGYQRQNSFNELVYGCDVKWYLREETRNYLAFSAGLLGRHGDAAAITLAVDWQSWTFAFSYDANLSKLATASHTLGAFEIGIVYRLLRKNSRQRAIPCPII